MSNPIDEYSNEISSVIAEEAGKLRDSITDIRLRTLGQPPEQYVREVISAAKDSFDIGLTKMFRRYSDWRSKRREVSAAELRSRTVPGFSRLRADIKEAINLDQLRGMSPGLVDPNMAWTETRRDSLIRHMDQDIAAERAKAADTASVVGTGQITLQGIKIGTQEDTPLALRESAGTASGAGSADAGGASIATAEGTATASGRSRAAPHRRSASTRIGIAVLQNQESLKPLLTGLMLLIEAKLDALRQATPLSNSDIAQYEEIKLKLQALIDASSRFVDSDESEAEPAVAAAAMSFSDGVRNWWASSHKEILDRGFGIVAGGADAGIFLGTLTACIMLEVPPALAAIVSGAVVPQGQKVVDAIKAFFGNGKKKG